MICSPFFSSAQPWDLARCIEHAQKNNLTIKQAEIGLNQQKMAAHVAKMQQLPSINGSVGQNFNFGRSIDPFTNTFENTTIRANNFSVSGSGVIYGGGRIQNNIQAEQSNLAATEFDVLSISNNIALQVTNAYLNVLFSKESLRIAKDRSSRTKDQLDRMQKLVDAGANSRENLLTLKAQFAQELRNVVNSENSVTLSKLTLEQLLQMNHNDSFEIVYPKMVEPKNMPLFSINEVVSLAMENQPEIKREMERLRASEYALKVAKASARPSLNAFGSVSSVFSSQAKYLTPNGVYDTISIGYVSGSNIPVMRLSPGYDRSTIPFANQVINNLGSSLGMSLSVPIFSAGQIERNIASAKFNMERAQLNKKQTENTLYQSVAQAVTNYQAAQKDFDADQAAYQAQEESFSFADKRYQEGMLNTVDYLNIKNNFIAAQSNLLQSKYRLWLRLKILEFYQGKSLTF